MVVYISHKLKGDDTIAQHNIACRVVILVERWNEKLDCRVNGTLGFKDLGSMIW